MPKLGPREIEQEFIKAGETPPLVTDTGDDADDSEEP